METSRQIRFKIYLVLVLFSLFHCAYMGDGDGFILTLMVAPLAYIGAFYGQK
jgi:hypothetical protein